jgi:hypothetical protein
LETRLGFQYVGDETTPSLCGLHPAGEGFFIGRSVLVSAERTFFNLD